MKAKISVLAIALLAFVSVMGSVSAATLTATVDFEGLAPGTIVTSLSSGNGVSGDAFPGSIVVLGDNSAQHVVGNAAMIFDSVCGGSAAGCTGNDTDLFAPDLGKTMIISEDLNGANPDDNGGGGWLDFDLTGFGDGVFTVTNANIVDTEGGGRIDFFNGVTLLSTIALPELADGEQALVPFNVDGVTNFRVYITESGAVDNINLSVETPDEPGGGEGCTPGFWKNRGLRDGYWAATGYAPTDLYSDVFGVGPAITLLDALGDNGGQEHAFHRHSTAALLNEAHPDIDYGFSGVLALVQNGYWSEALKDQFDVANNAGCDDDHDNHDEDDCPDGHNGRDRDGRNGRNGRGNGHNYDNNNGHGNNNHGNNNGRGRGNNGRSGRGRSN